jgi:serine phosphatase RsbU (regulator of sigma subunit)
VLSDVRADERLRASPAVAELGAVAYAGMPLTDNRGNVLGALCALDVRVRQWTERELTDLADLATVCSIELRLRTLSRQALQARHVAAQAQELAERSRSEAEDARGEAQWAQRRAEWANSRAEEAAERVRHALARSGLLLRAAEDLADTSGLAEVRQRVRDLVTGELKPTYVGLALAEDGGLQRLLDAEDGVPVEHAHSWYGVAADWPSARALRDGVLVTVTDRDAMVAGYGEDAVAAFDDLGLKSAACVPLLGARGAVGVLILGWDVAYDLDVTERAVLTAVAGYTAQAIERAAFLDERVTVARELQTAMLTELPRVPGLELAALYRPALTDDLVGGDWYDAYRFAPGGETAGDATAVAVTVGDITGHDTRAATIMGQVRAMLRQAAIDHPGRGPAAAVTALERSCEALDLDATGTLVHAQLTPEADGGWELTWTNAGHPTPLLALPDGSVQRLPEHDWLLWPGLLGEARAYARHRLPPGSTLLLYTDGLIERRGEDLDLAIDRLAGTLAAVLTSSTAPLADLIGRLTDQTAGPGADDDIVVLALRVPGRAG